MNVNTGDIISYQSTIYLSQEYIVEHAGISAGYLRVAKSRANKGTSESWQNVELHNTSYFKYADIPASSKYKLPTRDNLQQLAVRYDNDIVSLINAAKEDTQKEFLRVYKGDRDLALAAAIIHEANKYVINHKILFVYLQTNVHHSPLSVLFSNLVKLFHISHFSSPHFLWEGIKKGKIFCLVYLLQ